MDKSSNLYLSAISTQGLLASMGDVVKLKASVDLKQFSLEIAQFEQRWIQYCDYRPDNRRFALALTSIDGSVESEASYAPLHEYNERNRTRFRDWDFKYPTEVLTQCSSIQSLTSKFQQLGLCRIFKLDKGGFFPPHRDLNVYSFRILVTCLNSAPHQYTFIVDDKVASLEPGTAYLINTLKKHQVFSFTESAIKVVLSIPIVPENIRTLFQLIE